MPNKRADYRVFNPRLKKYYDTKDGDAEYVNTNNPWGFGGWIGFRYTWPDGTVLEIGKTYFRHLGPKRYAMLRYPDGTRERV